METLTNKIITGNHPPVEEIKLTHLDSSIITSPFKKGVLEIEYQNNINLKQIKNI